MSVNTCFSNQQEMHCVFKSLLKLAIKKTPKLNIIDPIEGIRGSSIDTPTQQRASNAENVSLSRRCREVSFSWYIIMIRYIEGLRQLLYGSENEYFWCEYKTHKAHLFIRWWYVKNPKCGIYICSGLSSYFPRIHYNDVIMGAIASQITSLTTVYSFVYSEIDQRKYQRSASLAFVRGIHRGPVNSPHKWPATRKMFPFDDVIMHVQYGEALINMQCDCRHNGVIIRHAQGDSLLWNMYM